MSQNKKSKTIPFTARKYPPRVQRRVQQDSRVSSADYMTPGAVNETLRQYILDARTIGSGDRGLKYEMLNEQYRAAPDKPQPTVDTGAIFQRPQESRPAAGTGGGSKTAIENETITRNIGLEEFHLHFDSVNIRDSASPPSGQFDFDMPFIGTEQTRNNIVSIRINSFYIPNINELILDENDRADFFFYRKVYLRFRNFPSITAFNTTVSSTSYHFEFLVTEPNGTAVLLIPVQDTIRFSNLVSSISELNCSFFVPRNNPFTNGFKTIRFPRTRISARFVAGSDPYFQIVTGNASRDIWGKENGTTVAIPAPGILVAGIATTSNATSPDTNRLANETMDSYVTEVNTVNNRFVLSHMDFTDEETFDFVIMRNRIMPAINMVSIITGRRTNYAFPNRTL